MPAAPKPLRTPTGLQNCSGLFSVIATYSTAVSQAGTLVRVPPQILVQLLYGESQAWLLAWGTIFGNTRGMLGARLYAFDGYSARVVWEVSRLQVGFIEVLSGDEIELRCYQPPPEGIYTVPATKLVERWRVVPSGL